MPKISLPKKPVVVKQEPAEELANTHRFSHESNKDTTYPNCNFVNSVGWVLLRFLKAKTKLFQFYTNNSLGSWYIQDYSRMVLAYYLGQDSRLPEPTLGYFQALNVSTHVAH